MPLATALVGGHQERNRRGGTENVPLIVGMGCAAELASKHLPCYDAQVRPLRDELEEGILRSISNTELNGHKTQRMANTANITFHGIESEALLIHRSGDFTSPSCFGRFITPSCNHKTKNGDVKSPLRKPGICASSGSACLADSDEPSHVVTAMKPDSTASRQMIRFSLDAEDSAAATEKLLTILEEAVVELRN